MPKVAYLKRSIAAQFTPQRFLCPNCGGTRNTIVDRKFVITQLRRCADCRLLYRTPTDDPAANTDFYENDYRQGFTTDVPSNEGLAELKRAGFSGGENDYAYYISVLTALGMKPGNRLFDYGCSWGYGSYQLAQVGYEVMAFEIATTRSQYAKEKLAVQTVDDMDKAVGVLAGQFDCFFSAHVIEHVPVPAKAFRYAGQLLAEGGLFVSFTPNGSSDHRAASRHWSRLWGEVHPNFIDDVFLDRSFKFSPRSVGSSPVRNASIPVEPKLRRLNGLEGSELFFAARKYGEAWG
jgi:2-polyprenyl-3-methyl-5-hydroxy-6-metoxy-1,4-benzoquinol methylase